MRIQTQRRTMVAVPMVFREPTAKLTSSILHLLKLFKDNAQPSIKPKTQFTRKTRQTNRAKVKIQKKENVAETKIEEVEDPTN